MDMDAFWENLFFAWCLSYDENMVPEYMRADPVRAYGFYAFREGVRLGLKLACGTFVEQK